MNDVASENDEIPRGTRLMDHQGKRVIVVSNDFLLTEFSRDLPKIQQSFDALCDADMREISELMSTVVSFLMGALLASQRNNQDRPRVTGVLLFNAANSLAAAIHLLRGGYTLQPGMIIRNIVESCCAAIHLFLKPEDVPRYEQGRLESTRTISTAKKALPPLGELYGNYSKNFSHIGKLHRSFQRVTSYKERNESLETNLMMIRMTAWILYVTSELVFHPFASPSRYWQKVEGGLRYSPSDEEKSWMNSFFGLPD